MIDRTNYTVQLSNCKVFFFPWQICKAGLIQDTCAHVPHEHICATTYCYLLLEMLNRLRRPKIGQSKPKTGPDLHNPARNHFY